MNYPSKTGRLLRSIGGNWIVPVAFSEHDRQFYLETSRIITAREYLHYEVSNYARDFTFRSRHNRKYWIRDPYLGLGPSAHSMRGTRRWWNARTIVKYLDNVRFTGNGIEASEILTDEQIALESLFLGFRNTHGIPAFFDNVGSAQCDHYTIIGRTQSTSRRGKLFRSDGRGLPSCRQTSP